MARAIRSKRNPSEPHKQPATLAKPSHILGDIAKIWDEMLGQTRPSIGAAGLEALCLQIARMRDAQARIAKEGLIVADRSGNPVAHPALAIERQAGADVRAWLAKYGRPR